MQQSIPVGRTSRFIERLAGYLQSTCRITIGHRMRLHEDKLDRSAVGKTNTAPLVSAVQTPDVSTDEPRSQQPVWPNRCIVENILRVQVLLVCF